MYTPAHFRLEDRAKLTALIQANSFATLTTHGSGGLTASHLPFLYDETVGPHGTLYAHLARANAQWRDFSGAGGTEALVVFHGDHGYISPTWYAAGSEGRNVPTWNYEAVHAYGVPRVIEQPERTVDLLERTIRRYEKAGSAYSVRSHSDEFLAKMVQAIVAFEIPVTRLEGKFKLSQNRSKEDLTGAIAGLEAAGDPASMRLAAAMRRENQG
jgi:transcriptional regulator